MYNMTDADKLILERVLQKIAKNRQYDDYKIDMTPMSSGGANYSSRLFVGSIKCKDEELKYFAKVAALGEKFREQMPTKMYYTEQYAYTRLAEIFEGLQNEHSVPEEHSLLMPTLYGYEDTEFEEVIVLQDLGPEGFSLYDRLKSFDWAYGTGAMRQLAILHSLSIALHHHKPEEFEEISNVLVCQKYDEDSPMMQMALASMERSIALTKEENRERLRSCLKEIMPKFMENYFEYDRSPVLLHGDFRMSNTMYRKHTDGSSEVRILDYQTLHIGSVVKDLMYFIFTGSDAEFRRQYYHQLLDFYYEQLRLSLIRLHVDPEKVFSREDFDYEIKKNHLYGLIFAVFSLPVVTVEEQNAPTVDDNLDIGAILEVELSQTCKERLNGVVDDYIRWGLI